LLIAYVNECGCSGELPSADSPVMPLLTIAGFAAPAAAVERLTAGLAEWKLRFFPGLCRDLADPEGSILVEVEGAELRRLARRSKKTARFAAVALGGLLDLLEAEEARLLGRVWIKGIDEPFNRRAIFSTSLQTILAGLGDLCARRGTYGIALLASGDRSPKETLSQQLFSRRFEKLHGASPRGGLERLAELPSFAHPANHAGLQLAGLLCSALLFPLAAYSFCRGHVRNPTHLSDAYLALKERLGGRLEKLQHRYQDGGGKWQGGITVSDPLGGRPGGILFR
jgi:hypothetical protein